MASTVTTTEPSESFDDFQRRLIEVEPHLPKRLRQAAAYALEHPDEFALGTASALARNAEVQASTLVRFAQTLGFAGFSELQEVFRSRLRNRWPDYSERLRALHEDARDSGDPIHLLFGFADSAAASIARLREVIQRRELERAVGVLAHARTIHCLGQRRSFCVAHYLTYALSQLGVPAALIDNVGGLGPEQLKQAGAGDALIAISFAPYSPFTVDLARRAGRAGVPIVAITDSALSPLAGLADVRFEIAESDFGSFRSLSATFCLAMTLAVAVGEKRVDAGASFTLLGKRPPRSEGDLRHDERGRRHHERD
jgi:DNA-binding MurR/RpiR family transcriptional regulator